MEMTAWEYDLMDNGNVLINKFKAHVKHTFFGSAEVIVRLNRQE